MYRDIPIARNSIHTKFKTQGNIKRFNLNTTKVTFFLIVISDGQPLSKGI